MISNKTKKDLHTYANTFLSSTMNQSPNIICINLRKPTKQSLLLSLKPQYYNGVLLQQNQDQLEYSY